MASPSGNGSNAGASVFVPSALRGIERSVSSLVTRYAEPVQQLGARTLGFVDRLIGTRLLARSMAGAPGAASASGTAGGATSASSSPRSLPQPAVWTVPWYQSAAPRPSRGASALEAPREAAPEAVTASVPEASVGTLADGGAASPPEQVLLDTAIEATPSFAPPIQPTGEAAAERSPEPLPVVTPTAAATVRRALESAATREPAASAPPSAPSAPSASSSPASAAAISTGAAAEPAMAAAPGERRGATSTAGGQPAAPLPSPGPAPSAPLAGAPASALPGASTTVSPSSTVAAPGTASVSTPAAVERRAAEIVDALADSTGQMASPAALPPALSRAAFGVPLSVGPLPVGDDSGVPELRGLAHLAWVDRRVERALAGKAPRPVPAVAVSPSTLPVVAVGPAAAVGPIGLSGAPLPVGSAGLAAADRQTLAIGGTARPEAVDIARGSTANQAPSPVYLDAPAGGPMDASEASAPRPGAPAPPPGATDLVAAAAQPATGSSDAASRSPQAARVPDASDGPVARPLPPSNEARPVAAPAAGPLGLTPSATGSIAQVTVEPAAPGQLTSSASRERPPAPSAGPPAGLPSGPSDRLVAAAPPVVTRPTPGADGSVPAWSVAAPSALPSAPFLQGSGLPVTGLSAELPAAWRPFASPAPLAGRDAPGAAQSPSLATLALPGLGTLRFLDGLPSSRTQEDTRVLPLRQRSAVEFLLLSRGEAAGTPSANDVAAPSAITAGPVAARSADGAGADSLSRPVYLPRGLDEVSAPTGVASPPLAGVEGARVEAAAPWRAPGRPGEAGAAAPARSGSFPVSPSLFAAGPSSPEVTVPDLAAPAEGPSYRPGTIAARSEHLAAQVGLRAAGMTVDFVDLVERARLPWNSQARAAVERSLLTLGHPPDVGPGTAAAPGSKVPTGEPAQAMAAQPTVGAPPTLDGGALSEGPAGADLIAGSVLAEGAATTALETRAAGPLRTGTPYRPLLQMVSAGQGGGGNAPSNAESWALLSIFPRSAPSSLPLAGGPAPSVAAALPPQVAAALARQPAPLRAAVLAALASGTRSASPLVRGAAGAWRGLGDQAPLLDWLSAVAPDVAAVWPLEATRDELPPAVEPGSSAAPAAANAEASAIPTGALGGGSAALERALLPDGHQPRGAFLFPAAAEFVTTIGRWEPPVTLTAATGAGEAVANGQPAWGGMPAVTTAPVLEALALAPAESSVPVPSAGYPSVGPSSAAPGASLAALAEGVAARQALLRIDEAPTLVTDQHPYHPDASRLDGAASSARTLVRTGTSRPDSPASSTSSSSYSPSRSSSSSSSSSPSSSSSSSSSSSASSSAQAASSLTSLVGAAASAESTARIVEALRSGGRGSSGDERVTVADLALIAVASASQQLAASPHGGGTSSVAPTRSPSPEPHHHAEKSPAAERAEIDALARAVLEDIHEKMAMARERSGEAWES